MSWLFWEEDETCYAPTAPFIHWVGPVHQQDIKYSLQDTPNIRISLSLSPLLSLSLISLPYSLSYIIYRFLSLPLISSTCLPLSLSLSLSLHDSGKLLSHPITALTFDERERETEGEQRMKRDEEGVICESAINWFGLSS